LPPLILAAGESRRFGKHPKLLAKVEGRPLLEHAIRAQCATPQLEVMDLLVVDRHQALDDERKGVHSLGHSVDAGSLENEIHPGSAVRR